MIFNFIVIRGVLFDWCPDSCNVTFILDMANDNMEDIETNHILHMMYMFVFLVVNIMIIIVCVICEDNDNTPTIHRNIESTSVRRRRQHEYLYRVVYESDVKCIDKLRMD